MAGLTWPLGLHSVFVGYFIIVINLVLLRLLRYPRGIFFRSPKNLLCLGCLNPEFLSLFWSEVFGSRWCFRGCRVSLLGCIGYRCLLIFWYFPHHTGKSRCLGPFVRTYALSRSRLKGTKAWSLERYWVNLRIRWTRKIQVLSGYEARSLVSELSSKKELKNTWLVATSAEAQTSSQLRPLAPQISFQSSSKILSTLAPPHRKPFRWVSCNWTDRYHIHFLARKSIPASHEWPMDRRSRGCCSSYSISYSWSPLWVEDNRL